MLTFPAKYRPVPSGQVTIPTMAAMKSVKNSGLKIARNLKFFETTYLKEMRN